MKKIFMFAAVAMMFASCSQTDVLNDAENIETGEISFARNFVNNNTRIAGEMTNATITTNGNNFGVWGYKTSNSTPTNVFDNTKVTYDVTGSKWGYSPVRFWDAQASYDFVATMPKETTTNNIEISSKTDNTGKITWKNIPLNALTTTGTDYLVSDAVGVNATDAKSTVMFTFKHILSKLNVFAKATYTSADNYPTVTLKKLDLYLPQGKAQYVENSHNGPEATMPLTASSDVKDAWTWGTSESDYANPSTTASEVQASDVPLGTDLYKKLDNSYFMAPTPTDLTEAKIANGEGANLKMDITFEVAYSETDAETYTYKGVDVQDLHTFTQGYITNLYVNINLAAIEFGVEKVISFANATVADWDDSDDNYIDELGYSFNFKDLAIVPAAGYTSETKVATIDTYGNDKIGTSATDLTYSANSSAVYSDAACSQAVTNATSSVAKNSNTWEVKVNNIPANTTNEVKTYYVKVVTNQGDSRVLAFNQAGCTPILKSGEDEIATTYSPGNPFKMTVAQLDEGKTARVIVINTTTNEEVQLTANGTGDIPAGVGTTTFGNDGTISSIVSRLVAGDVVSFTPAAGSRYTYSVEIHCEQNTSLYKKYTINREAFSAK